MPELVESINCPKCGGPLTLTTGEVIVTCPYCGTMSRMRGDKPFVLRHSMLRARLDRAGAERAVASWLGGGVMKPDDLRKASRFQDRFGAEYGADLTVLNPSGLYQGTDGDRP